MGRKTIYQCDICDREIQMLDGIGLRFESNTICRQHGAWNECGAFVCPNCLKAFSSAEREQALTKALKECMHVIEKGIAVRMMESWPVLKEIVPPVMEQAKAALDL